MTDATVIAFPTPPGTSGGADPFSDWLSWAECELSILGFELSASHFDWQSAYQEGLRPEVAAAQAARGFETG